MARDKSTVIASAAIAKFGLPILIGTALLIIGWFFLSAVEVETYLGKIHLTFWQLLGFLNSGSAFEAMMQGRSGASAGFYGFLAIVALAGPYVPISGRTSARSSAACFPFSSCLWSG